MRLRANVAKFSQGVARFADGAQTVNGQWVSKQGLAKRMRLATAQLDRFVAVNIQVDLGLAKNSIFANVERRGNHVVAGLYSNLIYFPYVGHIKGRKSLQAFKYAEAVEVPKVLKRLQDDFEVSVTSAFTD